MKLAYLLAVFGIWTSIVGTNLHAELATTSLASLEHAVASATTPKALVRLMIKEFEFVEDQGLFGLTDYWQSPEELWRRRKGDCEDYALFAQYALKKHGIEAYVVSIYGPNGYAHTIVIFKEKEVFQVINEDRLYRYNAKSLEEAITYVNPYWTWGAIAELCNGRGKSLKEIANHAPKPLDLFSEFPF